jgi:ATP-dependent exoDNAse (exonuclease V) alpha subunit
MCHEMFYKYFLVIKKIKPNLKFIISGNYDQLLPVNDRANFNYQDSVALHDICDGNRLNLSKCRRADDICFRKCSPENIPNLTKQDFGNEFTERHICYTNKQRIAINKIMMDKMVLHKKSKKSLNLDKLKNDTNSQDVRLLAGTPIIVRVNNDKHEIYNNECFTIKEIQHSKYNILIVDEFGETKDISFYDFQKFFYVSFCVTIHKSQGSTFDHPYSIHEWNHKHFCNRLKYVALSRCTKLENINII